MKKEERIKGIMEFVKQKKSVVSTDVEKHTGLTYDTVMRYLGTMVKENVLEVNRYGRPWYGHYTIKKYIQTTLDV